MPPRPTRTALPHPAPEALWGGSGGRWPPRPSAEDPPLRTLWRHPRHTYAAYAALGGMLH
eukprot:11983757-Alexandrium_andersonii.AAC.1